MLSVLAEELKPVGPDYGSLFFSLLTNGLVLLLIVVLIIVYFEFIHPVNQLRKRLNQKEEILRKTSEEMIEEYKKLYHLYLKVQEKKKEIFYKEMAHLHQLIEKKIGLEKEIRDLLNKTETVEHKELKRRYWERIKEIFHQLSEKDQDKFYHQILKLKIGLG